MPARLELFSLSPLTFSHHLFMFFVQNDPYIYLFFSKNRFIMVQTIIFPLELYTRLILLQYSINRVTTHPSKSRTARINASSPRIRPACQHRRCKRCGFDPWVGMIPWVRTTPWVGKRKWQCTPIFLPGESHGQRSLVGYSPLGLYISRYKPDELTHKCKQVPHDMEMVFIII